MDDAPPLLQRNQEQALAAWINRLNQIRIDSLLRSFKIQDLHLGDALAEIQWAEQEIELEVVARNLGGIFGMHGYIAEVAEVGIGNARERILGSDAPYVWLNDGGPADLHRWGEALQMKFSVAEGYYSLREVVKHQVKYPNFVNHGGRYLIPKDHFEIIKTLFEMPESEAGKHLSRSGGGPSLTDWKRVQRFFEVTGMKINDLEPSALEYGDVQLGAYEGTLEAEKANLYSIHRSLRDEAYEQSLPTPQQALKAVAGAAALEGGSALVIAVGKKRRQGKSLKEFTSKDWKEIVEEAGLGSLRGGVRGISIYWLTNFTATSAAVASSIVTVSFGIAEQANRLRRGEIDSVQFIENAELLSLEGAVSALSAFIGEALIPVPILGAIIGNTVGMIMYRAASDSLSEWETSLIARYLDEQQNLDEKLAREYQDMLDELNIHMESYLALIESAFSPHVGIALEGSVALALSLGVPSVSLLDTREKTHSYFVD